MKKSVIDKYSLLIKTSPSVMKVLYQDLTGDVSKPNDEQSKDIQERIKLMLDTQDPDIMIDLRRLLEKDQPSLTYFGMRWKIILMKIHLLYTKEDILQLCICQLLCLSMNFYKQF